jgi:23S rRNA pseudouridine1911/1915/1917 synthase
VGDQLYGGGLRLPKGATPELVAALRGFRRQALHAERLAFEHPVTHEPLSFGAARPADQQELIDALRADTQQADPDDWS